jgi:hypothetical protein
MMKKSEMEATTACDMHEAHYYKKWKEKKGTSKPVETISYRSYTFIHTVKQAKNAYTFMRFQRDPTLGQYTSSS